MKHIYSVLPFFGFFVFGWYIATNFGHFKPLNEYKQVSISSRDPAAIRKSYDFSSLEGSALTSALKERLVSGLKVHSNEADIGIELGHFVMKGSDGQKSFACQRFEKITLQFEGEGVAVAGELPIMEIEGQCEIAQDINSISPLWIPVAKILGEPVADGEFDFKDKNPIHIKFANVSDQWPKRWVLSNVKMSSAKESTTVDISGGELQKMTGRPVIINW